jgi:CheY-like chemotaxis protein
MNNPKPSVLIVEDDAVFAYAVSRFLKDAGYDTIVCQSSMAAFNELRDKRVDAVVADIKLTKGEPHGLAFARMIKDKSPEIPVVLITAYPELLKGEPSLPGPILQKPVALAELAKTLRDSLSNSSQ